jgi:hypothetical protein
LAEVWILHFAIRCEPRIDLWQGLGSPAPLRRSSQDRKDTIYEKAVAGIGIPPHKSSLLAGGHDLDTSRLAWRRMYRATHNQIKENKLRMALFRCIFCLDVFAPGGQESLS